MGGLAQGNPLVSNAVAVHGKKKNRKKRQEGRTSKKHPRKKIFSQTDWKFWKSKKKEGGEDCGQGEKSER